MAVLPRLSGDNLPGGFDLTCPGGPAFKEVETFYCSSNWTFVGPRYSKVS